MRRLYISLSVFISIISIALVIWSLQPERKSLGQRMLEAKYARPRNIDAHLTEGLNIRIDETDWMNEIPEIECGSEHFITAEIPNQDVNKNIWKRTLRIVPRLAGGAEDDFDWHQFGVDRNIPLDDSHSEPKSINVAPGAYRVRFYLVLEAEDDESGQMPIVHYLAERPLIVTPSPEGADCGQIPSEDSQGTFPVKPG